MLSDATGAIHLANEAGPVSAEALHETLMVLLHSNFAAVATTDAWAEAVAVGRGTAQERPGHLGDAGARGPRGRAA